MNAVLGRWAPAALQMIAIFTLSSIADLNTQESGLSDHAGHFIGYALLGGLLLRGFARAEWSGITLRSVVLAWLVSAGYGATDEFHQMFVPGRTVALDDWVADAVGAATAVFVIAVAAAGHRLKVPDSGSTAGPAARREV